MSYNFKKAAQKATTLSELMENREQIETDDILGKELTMVEFDLVPGKDKQTKKDKMYPIMIFAEFPKNYYNGGFIFGKICEAWVADFGGDIKACSAALKESGGVHIRCSAAKTNTGNNLTQIEILD